MNLKPLFQLMEARSHKQKAHLAVGFLTIERPRGEGQTCVVTNKDPWLVLSILHPQCSMSNQQTIDAIRKALSSPRLVTYENAVTLSGPDDPAAIALYAWNAQVSAALMAPLHICEVAMRNAASDAIEAVYGQRWPWSAGFERTLQHTRVGYSQRNDLFQARSNAPTTGKVIPELKFVFWQKLFTGRNDGRLWNPYLRQVLPHADTSKTEAQIRHEIYQDLEQIRGLRNRIAHHEPIFQRNLNDDLAKIEKLISYRCTITATWMMNHQQASALIAAKP